MSFACHILASFLLVFIFSTKGAADQNITIQGILDHDINLNIGGFQMDGTVDDIQWKKDNKKIAQYKGGKIHLLQENNYQMLTNGTLKIKHLRRSDGGTYKVQIYDKNGKRMFDLQIFHLRILERVSKPALSWSCTNRTVLCEVTNGTDAKLRLYQNEDIVREGHKLVVYHWHNLNAIFKCLAKNVINEETSTVTIQCSGKGLDIYLIAGICGGGVLFFIFMALLVLYVSKRRRQHRRPTGEAVEIRAQRRISEERGRKLHQLSGSAPQNPAASQPPPPPGHRPQAPGHRPPPPGHRVQQQQPQHQKRPLPHPGTHAHQQKGPPLPRPRVQPKSPRGATEHS